MVHRYRGTFTVFEGVDGTGKGVAIDSIADALRAEGLVVLDLCHFWKKYPSLPKWTDKPFSENSSIPLNSFDVLISEEPTYSWIGAALRQEVIAKNSRQYSAHMTAELYAADRMLLYQRVLLPALEAGKHVIQSRCVLSSMVYQPLQEILHDENPLTIEDVLQLEGNKFVLEHAPNLLLLATVPDVTMLTERFAQRKKKDDAIFEEIGFLRKIKNAYESERLRSIFESYGTNVWTLDASISPEKTAWQAVTFYMQRFPEIFHKKREI